MRRLRLLLLLPFLLLGACATLPQQGGPAQALLREAEAALDNGDSARALALLQQAPAEGEHRAALLATYLRLYRITDDHVGLRRVAGELQALEPDNIDAREILGFAALERGDPVAASTQFNAVLGQDPGRWQALNGLAIIADSEQRHADAESLYRQALALAPGHPRLLANLGWSRLLAGDASAAEALLVESLRVEPDAGTTSGNLAFAIAMQGRYEEARTLYTALFGAAVAANNVGFAAALRGDVRTARQLFREAISLMPRYYPLAEQNLEALGDPASE